MLHHIDERCVDDAYIGCLRSVPPWLARPFAQMRCKVQMGSQSYLALMSVARST